MGSPPTRSLTTRATRSAENRGSTAAPLTDFESGHRFTRRQSLVEGERAVRRPSGSLDVTSLMRLLRLVIRVRIFRQWLQHRRVGSLLYAILLTLCEPPHKDVKRAPFKGPSIALPVAGCQPLPVSASSGTSFARTMWVGLEVQRSPLHFGAKDQAVHPDSAPGHRDRTVRHRIGHGAMLREVGCGKRLVNAG